MLTNDIKGKYERAKKVVDNIYDEAKKGRPIDRMIGHVVKARIRLYSSDDCNENENGSV